MLGENIVPDERGKVTGIRALPAEVQGPRTELTFQTKGKILGIEFSNLGTIQSTPKPGGVLYGQGQGVATTMDGEIVSWTFQGVVKPGLGMAASVRGSVFFQTAHPKLARLNSMCALVEGEFDNEGNAKAKLWEWK